MKKVLSILAILAVVSFSANSQTLTSKKGENYLPEKGDWSIGFNIDGIFSYLGNSFNGTSDNSVPGVDFLSGSYFTGKRFTSATTATRYSANLSISSSKTGEIKSSGFDVTAGLGKEWRKGKTRLQGFYGADALVTYGSSKVGEDKTNNLGVGVNGFIGAEYFIFPKMALGAQYNYGVGFTSSEDAAGVKSSSFSLNGVGLNGGSILLNLYF